MIVNSVFRILISSANDQRNNARHQRKEQHELYGKQQLGQYR
jgi:hypothetical protein